MTLHLILLVVYSTVVVTVGLWTARYVRTSSAFFVAGRSLGPGLVLASMLAANIGAGATVNVAGLAYREGLNAWWWSGSAGIASFVLAFWVGPRLWALAKEHGFYTTGDFLEYRYGSAVRGIVTGLVAFGSLWILAAQLIAGAAIFPLTALQQQAAPGYIQGTVRSGTGAEAGVWVIAETKDLPTGFIKIVVTDDQGRYMLPDMPPANYSVWVRGYGLVDSKPITARPTPNTQNNGAAVNLTAVPAKTDVEAARVYPGDYWYSLLELPGADEFPGTGPTGNGIAETMLSLDQWMWHQKSTCNFCHQLGNHVTRTFDHIDLEGLGLDPADRREPVELDALLLGLGHLVLVGRHPLPGSAVDHHRVGSAEPLGAPGRVDGGVTAAVHRHAATQQRPVPLLQPVQERDRVDDPGRRRRGDVGPVAELGSHGEDDGVPTLLTRSLEVGHRRVADRVQHAPGVRHGRPPAGDRAVGHRAWHRADIPPTSGGRSPSSGQPSCYPCSRR